MILREKRQKKKKRIVFFQAEKEGIIVNFYDFLMINVIFQVIIVIFELKFCDFRAKKR